MNREIACSLPSGLPPDLEGAVSIVKLLEVLDKLPDENVDLFPDQGILAIKGGNGRRLRLVLESEIHLPVTRVELPARDAWQRLDDAFEEAVDLVSRCTTRKKEFGNECVHIHPKWLEASDDIRAARYEVGTFVQTDVLVRGRSLKEICQLGMTQGAETLNWLHFRNPLGLRLSVKKFGLESYPPLEQILTLRGSKLSLPKIFAEAAARAGVMSDDDSVLVRLDKGAAQVSSACIEGDFGEPIKIQYQGPTLEFILPYKLVPELLEQNTEVEVTEHSLRVGTERYTYVMGLQMTADKADVAGRLNGYLEDEDAEA
jgi:hypothetical protein